MLGCRWSYFLSRLPVYHPPGNGKWVQDNVEYDSELFGDPKGPHFSQDQVPEWKTVDLVLKSWGLRTKSSLGRFGHHHGAFSWAQTSAFLAPLHRSQSKYCVGGYTDVRFLWQLWFTGCSRNCKCLFVALPLWPCISQNKRKQNKMKGTASIQPTWKSKFIRDVGTGSR